YEQLKEKLAKEGLFADEYKKPFPKYPKKIGVATSDIGAAVNDIINIIKRRFPVCELVIVPTKVQGEQASPDIVKSLRLLDSEDDIDLIIVGRGGGSIEDLWAFNTEEVARAVFACSKPVISAVGHETDFTICDFVADLRAPTPSAAAELAVPNMNNILASLNGMNDLMMNYLLKRVEFEFQRFDSVQNSLADITAELIDERKNNLSDYSKRIKASFSQYVQRKKMNISKLVSQLNALSPLATVSRGYCIAEDKNGTIKSAEKLKTDDEIKLTFSDGSVNCRVI
ncbi:MAG: exodeoxyribonuclease VII large subunit, partial [Clostridiales bacterium]|nr:exodeoxyribonuclease VII large subunit [Clostridiales bacterium]